MKEANVELVNHEAELIGWLPIASPLSTYITGMAKVCTAKVDEMDASNFEEHKAFVCKLMQWGHWTPFEFVDLTFYLTTSRAVANELVRHRLMSFLQESQRYCRYDKGLKVILPTTFKGTLEADLWQDQVRDAYDVYLYLLEQKCKPEDARTVLPLATATNMVAKMNLREFRHFLNLRTAPAAWSEMRTLANLMAKQFAEQFPDEMFLIEDVWHKEKN